jgi:PKD repeat protein
MNDYGYEVIQTSDGGFAIIGSTESYAWHGKSDMWLIKTNSTGVKQWDIVAGDSENDTGRGIVQDAANDLVVCGTTSYDDGLGGGLKDWIYTIKFSNSYTPPVPSFTYTPQSPFFIQDPIRFDATGSTPGGPDTGIILYEWDFGDGVSSSGNVAEHTYITPGTYTVTLYITDSNGIRRETSQTVTAVALETQWERVLNAEPYGYYDIVKGDGSNFLIPGYYKQSTSNLNGAATKFNSSGVLYGAVFMLIIYMDIGMLFVMEY